MMKTLKQTNKTFASKAFNPTAANLKFIRSMKENVETIWAIYLNASVIVSDLKNIQAVETQAKTNNFRQK